MRVLKLIARSGQCLHVGQIEAVLGPVPKLLQRSVVRRVKHGLKNNFRRHASEIEHGVEYRDPGRVGADNVHHIVM
jgi:hypothetical protein